VLHANDSRPISSPVSTEQVYSGGLEMRHEPTEGLASTLGSSAPVKGRMRPYTETSSPNPNLAHSTQASGDLPESSDANLFEPRGRIRLPSPPYLISSVSSGIPSQAVEKRNATSLRHSNSPPSRLNRDFNGNTDPSGETTVRDPSPAQSTGPPSGQVVQNSAISLSSSHEAITRDSSHPFFPELPFSEGCEPSHTLPWASEFDWTGISSPEHLPTPPHRVPDSSSFKKPQASKAIAEVPSHVPVSQTVHRSSSPEALDLNPAMDWSSQDSYQPSQISRVDGYGREQSNRSEQSNRPNHSKQSEQSEDWIELPIDITIAWGHSKPPVVVPERLIVTYDDAYARFKPLPELPKNGIFPPAESMDQMSIMDMFISEDVEVNEDRDGEEHQDLSHTMDQQPIPSRQGSIASTAVSQMAMKRKAKRVQKRRIPAHYPPPPPPKPDQDIWQGVDLWVMDREDHEAKHNIIIQRPYHMFERYAGGTYKDLMPCRKWLDRFERYQAWISGVKENMDVEEMIEYGSGSEMDDEAEVSESDP
jgi:hypothetical protein